MKNNYYKSKNYIHYSSCHEDADTLLKFTDNCMGKSALSIGSAGDNSFSLLCADFSQITVLDSNPSQIYLIKLKAHAIKNLSYTQYLTFLGILDGDRLSLYRRISPSLSEDARNYFDKNIFLIEKGLILSGKFDRYLHLFATRIMPLIHKRKTVESFFAIDDIESQRKFYDEKFDSRRFRLAFSLFFSEKNMKKRGRDAEYFKYLEKPLAKFLYDRVSLGFKSVPNSKNPYMQFAALGSFRTLPHSLREENFERIKKNLDKLEFVCADFEVLPTLGQKYDFFNLSDIFEYVSHELTAEYARLIEESSNLGARVVFYNMLVPRTLEGESFCKINTDAQFLEDKAFYYSKLCAYEVIK